MVLILEIISSQPPKPSVLRKRFGPGGGSIGRESDNSWILPHAKVSSHHARISCSDGTFYIEDTSRNGVFLNARRLTRGEAHRLQPGDRLLVDPYEIGVSLVDNDGLPPRATDDAGCDLIEGAGASLNRLSPEPAGDSQDGGSPRESTGAFEAPESALGELDPLVLLDLQKPAPQKMPSGAKDLGSPLDAQVRRPPVVPDAEPAPSGDLSVIPADYDPLSDPFAPAPQDRWPVSPAGDRRLEQRISIEEPIEFSAYFPQALPLSSWRSIAVYVHVPSARSHVDADSRRFVDGAARPDVSRTRARSPISRGAEIQIVPSLPNCEFNPPRASILWLEEWQRVVFRVRALSSNASLRLGLVQFFVGPVVVGELTLWPLVADPAASASEPPTLLSRDEAYQAVFVSYCHSDATIVEQLERAYSVLGMTYIRDVQTLRSGEVWNATILAKISTADIFQLCWSHRASASPFVEQEWRHALELRRPRFIRPVYWEIPMPSPPVDLADLHFARLHWLQPIA